MLACRMKYERGVLPVPPDTACKVSMLKGFYRFEFSNGYRIRIPKNAISSLEAVRERVLVGTRPTFGYGASALAAGALGGIAGIATMLMTTKEEETYSNVWYFKLRTIHGIEVVFTFDKAKSYHLSPIRQSVRTFVKDFKKRRGKYAPLS